MRRGRRAALCGARRSARPGPARQTSLRPGRRTAVGAAGMGIAVPPGRSADRAARPVLSAGSGAPPCRAPARRLRGGRIEPMRAASAALGRATAQTVHRRVGLAVGSEPGEDVGSRVPRRNNLPRTGMAGPAEHRRAFRFTGREFRSARADLPGERRFSHVRGENASVLQRWSCCRPHVWGEKYGIVCESVSQVIGNGGGVAKPKGNDGADCWRVRYRSGSAMLLRLMGRRRVTRRLTAL